MLHISLYEPEIPPNTGNIIRLCANAGAQLHLIEPLGFRLDDARLKRAGLDYHEFTSMKIHAHYQAFSENMAKQRVFACSTKGQRIYTDIRYQAGDVFLFGPETRGLPQSLLENYAEDQIIRIPMQAGSRSLNLSNAVAIILYEAWRQMSFPGGS